MSYDSENAKGWLDIYRNGNKGRTLISNSSQELPIVHNRIKARWQNNSWEASHAYNLGDGEHTHRYCITWVLASYFKYLSFVKIENSVFNINYWLCFCKRIEKLSKHSPR